MEKKNKGELGYPSGYYEMGENLKDPYTIDASVYKDRKKKFQKMMHSSPEERKKQYGGPEGCWNIGCGV